MAPHSGEMVKAAMKAKGMTQVELANRIGKDQTLISRCQSGQIEVSDGVARSIAEVLEIDFEELRRQLQRDRFERRKEHLKAEFREILNEDDNIYHVGTVSVLASDMVAIRLMDSIPSDTHDQSEEEAEWYGLPPGVQVDAERSFALWVRGENMIDDIADEGDIIVVDPTAEVRDGDRVLVILSGEPMLKRMYRRRRTVVLQSSEDREDPVTFLTQKDDFEVVGKVVLCTRIFISS